MRALARHAHCFGNVSDGLTLLNAFDDQSSGERREPSVTV
jgi:hypothetical protein